MASPFNRGLDTDEIKPPPEDLVPLRCWLREYANQLLYGPQPAPQEHFPSPRSLLFGMWQLGAIELWGRRGRLDAPLTLIPAPPPERQSSAYDMDELEQHSCLRRHRGECFYDIWVRAAPIMLRIMPIYGQGRPLIYDSTAKPLRGPANYEAIRAHYQTLSPAQRLLRGAALHQAIRRVRVPQYRDTDPPPPGLSGDVIDFALKGIKDGC